MTTRADMGRSLALDPSSPTKTFVVEAHADQPRALLEDIVGAKNVEPTGDAFLFKALRPEGTLWVDQLDGRFWSIHTDLQTHAAKAFLSKEIERRRELDWMWLPSGHLRNLWPNSISRRVHTTFDGRKFLDTDSSAGELRVQLSGRSATNLLDHISRIEEYSSSVSFDRVQASLIDPDLGQVEEGVSRMGRFVVTGDSFEFHAQFVRSVVQRYKRLVKLCEQRAISYRAYATDTDGTGGTLRGGPIVLNFKRNIADLDSFATTLFSARAPYRLWGSPEIKEHYATVHAVDLHVANDIRMDIGRNWLRIYLNEGACGNTVARLVANLQHTFDSALSFTDPELQIALTAETPALSPANS
ncbi:hypothetical protein [Actinophytocola oryzae]|uniref:Uncharacterized protein n=1 Tax=Actinophytocola oryzae TaxID=502181 RepID=A0A4R7VRM4_9PSEU|nr:hypothetical protein [Actinophytocola oryzae]TDV52456.1 hypothetical protein CLV71_105588 [Actinophytocola oryzae]